MYILLQRCMCLRVLARHLQTIYVCRARGDMSCKIIVLGTSPKATSRNRQTLSGMRLYDGKYREIYAWGLPAAIMPTGTPMGVSVLVFKGGPYTFVIVNIEGPGLAKQGRSVQAIDAAQACKRCRGSGCCRNAEAGDPYLEACVYCCVYLLCPGCSLTSSTISPICSCP